MEELKTLKDIEKQCAKAIRILLEPHGGAESVAEGIVFSSALKAEAVKWVKALSPELSKLDNIQMIKKQMLFKNQMLSEWIISFFNITEEDFKMDAYGECFVFEGKLYFGGCDFSKGKDKSVVNGEVLE